MVTVITFIEEFLVEIVITVVFLSITYIGSYLIGLRSKNIMVDMKTTIIRTPEEEERHAKKGLILILSYYSSYSGKIKSMTEEEIKSALEKKDYKVFDFQNSNFGHAIKAVETHSKKLDHCWLIGSYVKDSRFVASSAINFAETFTEYLMEKELNLENFYGRR